MVKLEDLQIKQGARLALDGIPLDFGDQKVEYHAALEQAVLMDRSHEGRIEVTGRDRIQIMQRISTNDLMNMRTSEGRPTVFTNANARILDRVTVYNRDEAALVITEPGRGGAVQDYLRRNIFFNDNAHTADLTASTSMFALHGPCADAIVMALGVAQNGDSEIAGVPVFIARRKPLVEAHWVIITPTDNAAEVWTAVQKIGKAYGLAPAGSLTYNVLRVRRGRPGVNRELSLDYIPLEVGLWDEVSFSKGCYTGQEVIARMESRNRLASIMVTLELDAFVESPAEIRYEGRRVGQLTSSVTSPDGEIFAIGVIKVPLAQSGQQLITGVNDVKATVIGLAGSPPPKIGI